MALQQSFVASTVWRSATPPSLTVRDVSAQQLRSLARAGEQLPSSPPDLAVTLTGLSSVVTDLYGIRERHPADRGLVTQLDQVADRLDSLIHSLILTIGTTLDA